MFIFYNLHNYMEKFNFNDFEKPKEEINIREKKYQYISDDLNFEQRKGAEQEINYLGSIDGSKYAENVKNKLIDSFVIKNLAKSGRRKYYEAKKDWAWLKEEKGDSDVVKRLLKDVTTNVDRVMNIKVIKNRHKYLYEISKEDQFRIIEKSQRGSDPSDPSTRFANDLHAEIIIKMKESDYSVLEYYTAQGTNLDYCGVDAFFKYMYIGKDGKRDFVRVCLDLTSNTWENKSILSKEKTMAGGESLTDVILFIEDENYDRSKEKNKKMRGDFAEQIIKVIKQKIEEKEQRKLEKASQAPVKRRRKRIKKDPSFKSKTDN